MKPLTVPTVHVIFAVPVATPDTCPPELTVATVVALLVQAQEPVIFEVDESEYVPVAVICSGFPPTLILGLTGVTAIDCKVGGGPLAAALNVAMRPAQPELIFCVKDAE